ncbi:putative reverse transcriptase zinc-binding domain-containing protein [Medicago truncatula]|uniref:Putative reverse transcriptase zinc-binding domain-containing protein n=1 Tax=Medicago truncatula TaxID=3880 RepID=A0A396IGT2_MEDTR|nr:putative reverse transcriptase zinc-binding domain-containing protein [Medicago truncatula]
MLRGFEMASGLKVNYHKSSLIGVNVSRQFMEAACRFLHCSEGSVPFNYLGLPVGANSKKLSTWEPMLEQLRNRLNSWGFKYVSLGGRITLLNSVLNAIPIFYLSFMKIPTKVVKKVTRIQRDFLWGGVGGGRKICWVKWKTICQPKSKGGLGVRDVKMVNLSLMAKWKWRMLQDELPLWKTVLREKYGENTSMIFSEEGTRWPRFASGWWKELKTLEVGLGANWFSNNVVRKVSNERGTSFWKDKWIEEDRWDWLPEEGGKYTVRSSYRVLEEGVLHQEGLSGLEEEVFSNLWKSPAPSKVVAFSWMALRDRIPTRTNLRHRNVLAPREPCVCVLCGEMEEKTSHLFLHCEVSLLIWRKVLDWLEINFITPQNLHSHYACWNGEVNSRKLRKAFLMIWHASIWMIWKERNARIFKNQFQNFDEVVDNIKAVSWCWSLSRLRIVSCFFYEWCWNPRECLRRR